MNKNLLAIVKV